MPAPISFVEPLFTVDLHSMDQVRLMVLTTSPLLVLCLLLLFMAILVQTRS